MSRVKSRISIKELLTKINFFSCWLGDPNDAFWLAQAYFLHQQYARAEQILTQPFYLPGPRQQQNKGKGREVNGTFNGTMNDPEGPGAKDYSGPDIHVPDGDADGGLMLIDRSVSCRYLAAQCMVRRRK